MPVPKFRHTKSKRNRRRMHLFLERSVLSLCPKCGKPVLPHTVCKSCGYYKGAEIINVLEKLTKKERKKREKEMKAQAAEKKETKKEGALSWEELSKK
jgi:large subunit ribosomal protein L32